MGLTARANRALIIKLIAAAITYGFSVLLARTMPTPEFGKVVLFLNAALILSVIGARGQQIAALRFLPPLVQVLDKDSQITFQHHLYCNAAPTTLAIFAIALGGAVITLQSGGLLEYSLVQLVLGLLLIPLVGWVDLQSHIARGYHLILLSLIPKEILWRGVTAILVLVLFLSGGMTLISATPVLLALTLTLFLIGLVQRLWLAQRTVWSINELTKIRDIPEEWRSSTNPFWVTSVSNIFLANADVVMVGIFTGPTTAGYYFAANRLAMLLAFPLTSYNVVLGPMLAEAWHRSTPQNAERLIHNATLKTTLPTILLGLILAGLAPQFLQLFGPDFITAATPLRILILAGVLNAASGPADIALNMCGFQRPAMLASAASLVISVVALSLGAVTAGAVGIALAVLFGTVVRKAIYWWLAQKHMSIRTDIFATLGRNPNYITAPKQ